ncbi:hypothetical protein CC80DRAFT_272361 [Byssothecium circinans]|uniref:Uncharacterized protein n=1 Tax=Byssothecium circinans TaxID=147558 RepID=A0A6A5T9U8_9PLEO|nr:hypothetical protein CC80DRAFT_272361 [Byssothecium circinans]
MTQRRRRLPPDPRERRYRELEDQLHSNIAVLVPQSLEESEYLESYKASDLYSRHELVATDLLRDPDADVPLDGTLFKTFSPQGSRFLHRAPTEPSTPGSLSAHTPEKPSTQASANHTLDSPPTNLHRGVESAEIQPASSVNPPREPSALSWPRDVDESTTLHRKMEKENTEIQPISPVNPLSGSSPLEDEGKGKAKMRVL